MGSQQSFKIASVQQGEREKHQFLDSANSYQQNISGVHAEPGSRGLQRQASIADLRNIPINGSSSVNDNKSYFNISGNPDRPLPQPYAQSSDSKIGLRFHSHNNSLANESYRNYSLQKQSSGSKDHEQFQGMRGSQNSPFIYKQSQHELSIEVPARGPGGVYSNNVPTGAGSPVKIKSGRRLVPMNQAIN